MFNNDNMSAESNTMKCVSDATTVLGENRAVSLPSLRKSQYLDSQNLLKNEEDFIPTLGIQNGLVLKKVYTVEKVELEKPSFMKNPRQEKSKIYDKKHQNRSDIAQKRDREKNKKLKKRNDDRLDNVQRRNQEKQNNEQRRNQEKQNYEQKKILEKQNNEQKKILEKQNNEQKKLLEKQNNEQKRNQEKQSNEQKRNQEKEINEQKRNQEKEINEQKKILEKKSKIEQRRRSETAISKDKRSRSQEKSKSISDHRPRDVHRLSSKIWQLLSQDLFLTNKEIFDKKVQATNSETKRYIISVIRKFNNKELKKLNPPRQTQTSDRENRKKAIKRRVRRQLWRWTKTFIRNSEHWRNFLDENHIILENINIDKIDLSVIDVDALGIESKLLKRTIIWLLK